jgi:hypothetical protein
VYFFSCFAIIIQSFKIAYHTFCVVFVGSARIIGEHPGMLTDAAYSFHYILVLIEKIVKE